MKHITILVPEGKNNLSSITGAYKILSRAEQYWQTSGKTSRFAIHLAGTSKEVGFHDGLFTVKPHKQISEITTTDLIIIPSLNHQYELAVRENGELVDWIARHYKNGAEVASICTGAFLLAASGLLNGKKCSTHWSAAEAFRSTFPKVNLQPDRLVTDEQGIYTNGGAYSFLNLILYLVEKHYDRQTAVYCSKVFQIDMDRQSQSAFMIFTGQKAHGDELVLEAQAYIEDHLHEKVSFEALAAQLAVGRRNFDRRFGKATGNTPVEYMQRVKIEAAKRALETSRKTISEIMFEVGYADEKAFREVFRKIAGMSPAGYRKKYGRDTSPENNS